MRSYHYTIRPKQIALLLLLSLALLFGISLLFGTVEIPLSAIWDILLGKGVERSSWETIVLESRLPRATTAMLAGASLSVAGLMMQTAFGNPLAGPSILGIDAGASLGVAIVMLVMGGSVGTLIANYTISGYLAVVLAAFLGAVLVLGIIISFASVVRSNTLLLIIGIMVGYVTSSVISLVSYMSTSDNLFSYTLWGMGDFSGVSLSQLPFFALVVLFGLGLSILLIKPLNALLLGERYARNLGIRVRAVRFWLLIATGVLVAITTAFCGPISFLGLAVPHMARLLLRSSNHNSLLPITLLLGSVVALLCNVISTLPGQASTIPLNAITPVIGAPIIIYIIVNQRKIEYFN